MVHTLAPWTSKWRMAKIFGQIDTGEQAVRLGSIVNFDRRGNVLFLENFENGIARWAPSYVGSGSIAHSSTYARSGGGCLKMVTGGTTNDYTRVTCYIPIRLQSTIGLEVSTILGGTDTLFSMLLQYFDGTNWQIGGLQYDNDSNNLKYRNSLGGWTDIMELAELVGGNSLFHNFKLAFDPSTEKYIRAILDGTEYDIDTAATYKGTSSTSPHCRIELNAKTIGGGGVATYYVDDVIATINEV